MPPKSPSNGLPARPLASPPPPMIIEQDHWILLGYSLIMSHYIITKRFTTICQLSPESCMLAKRWLKSQIWRWGGGGVCQFGFNAPIRRINAKIFLLHVGFILLRRKGNMAATKGLLGGPPTWWATSFRAYRRRSIILLNHNFWPLNPHAGLQWTGIIQCWCWKLSE